MFIFAQSARRGRYNVTKDHLYVSDCVYSGMYFLCKKTKMFNSYYIDSRCIWICCFQSISSKLKTYRSDCKDPFIKIRQYLVWECTQLR